MSKPVPSGAGLMISMDRPRLGSQSPSINRLGEGNTSNAKSLGEGVSELRINRGPGYRIYFGWDSKVLVILLGGGTKKRQQSDIATALRHWRSYKVRKAAGRTKRS
jgi:putative addiction module killer protein